MGPCYSVIPERMQPNAGDVCCAPYSRGFSVCFCFLFLFFFQKVSASIETITTSVFKSLSLRTFRDV